MLLLQELVLVLRPSLLVVPFLSSLVFLSFVVSGEALHISLLNVNKKMGNLVRKKIGNLHTEKTKYFVVCHKGSIYSSTLFLCCSMLLYEKNVIEHLVQH